jgi:hypothetical protein
MGVLEMRPQETVFYPAPYDETVVAPVVITNQRVIVMGREGRHELDAKKITFIGRASSRPLIFLGLFFLLSGLPVVGYGAYLWWTVHGMPTFEEQKPAEDMPSFEDPGVVRWKAIGFFVAGAVCLLLGLVLAARQRHVVVCRADKRVLKLRVKDKTTQNQVMMTVQSVLNAVKAMG